MNENQLEVCVVSPSYHLSVSGVGKQSQLLTERLAEEGVPIFAIARRIHNLAPAAYSPKVPLYRVWNTRPDLHNFEEVRTENVLASLSFSLACGIQLLRRRKDYRIVHFHGASLPLFVNLPLLILLRKKVVAKVATAKIGTEAGSLKGRHRGLGNLLIRLLKHVDAFVATSSEIEEGLLADGFEREKINRIPNFVDLTLFQPVTAEERERWKEQLGFPGRTVVTFSGTLVERKGVAPLIRAWKTVASADPRAHLLLLGKGPLVPTMQKLAEELGIAGSVTFYGHTPKVAEFLHATDLFVLPSLQEGMPNTLLEAMACGLPAVATRIGGVVDVMQDGENGIIVEAGDAEGLSAGILRFLEDRVFAERMGVNAHKTIRDRFSLDIIAGRYIALYRKLLCP